MRLIKRNIGSFESRQWHLHGKPLQSVSTAQLKVFPSVSHTILIDSHIRADDNKTALHYNAIITQTSLR